MRLLLISNSTGHGEGYLDHCMEEILDFLGSEDQMAFVPFALHDGRAYGRKVARRFAKEGIRVKTVVAGATGKALVERSPAVFVGGGNSFRLLRGLQQQGLVEILRRRVEEGMLYMGASAGSNVAAPTIKTTNDMPIVQPISFGALDLVPFQINPHYLDPDPESTHMGETREQRLAEYLEENTLPVVAIREGSWIRVEGSKVTLGGRNGARIFRRGADPEEREPGSSLADLFS
jgi:dipeptidase E